jgi:exodeoxyribonuclease-3
LRVVSFNANGLRSAARKGFFRWFTRQRADVLCVQELKAHEHQLAENVFEPRGFHRVCHTAQRPGYSGVALYARAAPLEVVQGIGVPEFDAEGRYLEAHFGSLTIASAYFPSGSSSPARQEAKFRFLEAFDRRLEVLQRNSRPLVFCGDFNMAHRPIDLKNWRANQDYPGFTPAERAWLDTLFDARNMVDAFRAVNQEPGQYTWWSNRGRLVPVPAAAPAVRALQVGRRALLATAATAIPATQATPETATVAAPAAATATGAPAAARRPGCVATAWSARTKSATRVWKWTACAAALASTRVK